LRVGKPHIQVMSISLIILLLVAIAATAYVLVRGVVAMATGGGTLASAQQQQNWMRKRVLYQAIAILLVAFILVSAGAAGNQI
jgi:uncharacterized membrane protein HdeD (DUF308 family)